MTTNAPDLSGDRERLPTPGNFNKEEFAQAVTPVLVEIRKAFEEITSVGEGSGDFIDPSVSDYADEESDQKNQDLDKLIVSVKSLVDKILKKEIIRSGERNRRLEDVGSIEVQMVELSNRFQSGERGLRGVRPHPLYGMLEADIGSIYDNLTIVLEDVKKYLDAR